MTRYPEDAGRIPGAESLDHLSIGAGNTSRHYLPERGQTAPRALVGFRWRRLELPLSIVGR
jgi:hypothetical protein